MEIETSDLFPLGIINFHQAAQLHLIDSKLERAAENDDDDLVCLYMKHRTSLLQQLVIAVSAFYNDVPVTYDEGNDTFIIEVAE